MDANARTGMRGIGWTDSKVLGPYGRDELKDNGERLLIHATDKNLALLDTYYATPARGISYTVQNPNRGKAQYRLDYILTRKADRRLVRNVTVRTPPMENAESDHNLVIGNVRLLGRTAPNRPKRVVLVVLKLTRIIKSVVTGQAQATLELRNTPGQNTNNPRWYTRVFKSRRAIDLPRLTADPHLRMNFQEEITDKLACPIAGTTAGSIDDMTSVLT